MERAKQRDERTANLFTQFFDKYNRTLVTEPFCGLLCINSPLQPIKVKKKHLFAIPRGERETQLECGSHAN